MPLLGRSPVDWDQMAIRETQDKEKEGNNRASQPCRIRYKAKCDMNMSRM